MSLSEKEESVEKRERYEGEKWKNLALFSLFHPDKIVVDFLFNLRVSVFPY
jgi:hypothetical protein